MTSPSREVVLLVCLALIGLALVAQTVLMGFVAQASRRTAKTAMQLAQELNQELHRVTAQVTAVTHDVKDVAEHGRRQVERIERALDVTVAGGRKVRDTAARLLPPPGLRALYKGLRHGLDVYRTRRG